MIRSNRTFLLAVLVALASAGYVMVAMPPSRVVESLGILLFKLVPFLAASVAIATIDLDLARRFKAPTWALPLGYLVFFCIFVPKIFFHADDHHQLYYVMLMCSPYVILLLALSYRFGGASTESVLRFAWATLLLMLSGLEDLAFLVVNKHTDPEWQQIPEVWTWASHMTVFLGHPAHKHEAYAFIAVHVCLAVLVLFVPLKLRRARPVGAAVGQAA